MDLKTWNHYLEELAHPEFVDTASLEQQTELDPQIWDGDKLKPEIADRLYLIAKEFFQSLELGPDVVIKDVILTGSLASYNWSEFSDIDLHILIDFKKLPNVDLYKDYFKQKTINWNRTHDIFIKGYEVELYIQDVNEPHHALGIYSITNNRFIKKPTKFSGKIDYQLIKQKASDLMDQIDEVYDLYAEKAFRRSKDLGDYIADKIRKYRKVGLQTGGVYSIENLVFKVLRRNDYIKKLYTLRTKAYDSEMSINGGVLQEAVRAAGVRFKRGDQRVINDVLEAAAESGADEFAKQLLLGFLKIESGANAEHTFYNPDMAQYKGIEKRPGRINGIRPIGPFQILQAYQNAYRKYGYDPGQFGDPKHQAKVVLNFIQDQRSKYGENPARIYLTWNQGAGGAKKIYDMLKTNPDTPIGSPGFNSRLARNMSANFSSGALSRYGIANKAGITPAIFVDRYNRLLGFVGDAKDYKKVESDGTEAYILGDSNTVGHERYWTSWVKKNFPASNVNFRAVSGHSISQIMKQLNKIDPKTAKTIIIGSLGGNDAQDLKDGNFEAELAPDGRYHQNVIVPLMRKLKEFQDAGAKIAFFGLPFGRSAKPVPNDRREAARAAMDISLAVAAQQFGIPYQSVFEATKAIKGQKGGVHYSGKGRKAYRDLLSKMTGGSQPSSADERAYAAGKSKESVGFKKGFLSGYKNIQKAGLTFDKFYADLEKVFPDQVGRGKEILPRHGKDRVFGPEHYAALQALAGKTKDEFYLALVNIKEKTKQDMAIAKAEDKAAQKVEKALGIFSEQTEPYQRAVKKVHRKMKIKLIGKGGSTYDIGGKMKKPSYERSKSAPPMGESCK